MESGQKSEFPPITVELFMLSHVEKRKKSVAGKSIVLRGQKVV
jgi:hypothetical protein